MNTRTFLISLSILATLAVPARAFPGGEAFRGVGAEAVTLTAPTVFGPFAQEGRSDSPEPGEGVERGTQFHPEGRINRAGGMNFRLPRLHPGRTRALNGWHVTWPTSSNSFETTAPSRRRQPWPKAWARPSRSRTT